MGPHPTRENIHLYLTSHHTPHPPPRAAPLPPLPAIPPDTRSQATGATATCSGITASPSAFISSHPPSRRPRHPARRPSAGPGNTITLRLLRTRQELLDSFARDSIVLYFGHANFGKGIIFPPHSGDAPIPMGRDTLLIPERHLAPEDTVIARLDNGLIRIRGGADGLKNLNVQCNLFGYLGCRTDLYFRDIWQAHFPRVDFVATTYVTHSIAAAPAILHTWLTGLQRGHSLAAIIHDLNQNQSAEILFGRINETTRYHNPATHPAQLFTH